MAVIMVTFQTVITETSPFNILCIVLYDSFCKVDRSCSVGKVVGEVVCLSAEHGDDIRLGDYCYFRVYYSSSFVPSGTTCQPIRY